MDPSWLILLIIAAPVRCLYQTMSPGNMFILSRGKSSLLGKKDLKKRTKRIQKPSRQIASSSESYPSVFTVQPLFDVRRSDHRSIVYHWPDNSQS